MPGTQLHCRRRISKARRVDAVSDWVDGRGAALQRGKSTPQKSLALLLSFYKTIDVHHDTPRTIQLDRGRDVLDCSANLA